MPFIIPERFEQNLHPSVRALLTSDFVTDWSGFDTYFSTTPYFFKEYTIHGTEHINNVLKYADKLITNDTLEKFEDKEIAVSVLVLAIVLHDLGMFIQPSGLKFLIGEVNENESKSSNFEEWKYLWNEHIQNMKYASGTVLDNVFGDEEYKFNIESKPFCADFIRKYHHNLAFQIAVEGFPGATLNDSLKNIDNNTFVELAGLIAMSHGMTLRDQELESKINNLGYEDYMPLNVPVYYLMAVLRIADLLDAGAERAPKVRFDMNAFSSLYSKNEWKLNEKIRDRQWCDNKEVLHIIAKPENSWQFVKLQSWFDYWQNELDLSWAVIGEKYGNRYFMTIRRITSSLQYSNYDDFVTNEVSIKVNPDIVKMLIEPLYGNDPSYGVRELIQNAVDACNERKVIDGTEGEITVNVDTNKHLFTIKDNGIGMTEKVISDYFLTAGASFRDSTEWRRDFLDDKNKPKFARSGRFGVGAFAAFLIGPEVTVTTRNIKDNKGYRFSFSQKPQILNIEKVSDIEVGTEINIKISKDTCLIFQMEKKIELFDTMWFNWYRLKTPKVTYYLNEQEVEGLEKYDLKKGEDADGWFGHEVEGFESFHWSVVNNILLCNGIVFQGGHNIIDSNELIKQGVNMFLSPFRTHPSIAVKDPENNLSLDLRRKEVTKSIRIPESLIIEFGKYRLAEILTITVKAENECCGFIPNEVPFISNTRKKILYVKVSTDSYLPPKNVLFANETVIVVSNSSFIEKNFTRTLFDSQKSIIKNIPDANEKIYTTLGGIFDRDTIPAELQEIIDTYKSNIASVHIYDPQEDKIDNIMKQIVRDYIPYDVNGGWIPFDIKKRQEMYPKAFDDLRKYMDDIEKDEKRGENYWTKSLQQV